MSQPLLPTFPEGTFSLDNGAVQEISRRTLACLQESNLCEGADGEKALLPLADIFGLSDGDLRLLASFFVNLWKYLVYHRLGGQSLQKTLESVLPPSYVEIVSNVWYSDGPAIFTHLARRTASDRARVKDISWSVCTQTASDCIPDGDVEHGIRLDISTDKGMEAVYLNRRQLAALVRETNRIQAEIDKLLE
ncbi:hypothetical protein Q1695_002265 [Nippostrongylus brasiliensis]|nr:hypothetical protein Q1695_002265 [Nippostrongylus brasiliensis]